ncbi:hypothetical protein HY025_03300 [Candidatus Daviesbacteria bacterium]|nr:hypothetical protein [Candidatus Daviesbacteria bacterium]
MLKIPQKYFKFILLILIWLAFFLKAVISLDPDFGWHLKMGELILSSGIPKTDPFSYSMPSYPFVDHEWLSGVIFSLLYPLTQSYLLGVIYASFAFFALLIIIPSLSFTNLSIMLLSASVLLPFSGIRPQVISWFLFSLFLRLIFDQKLKNYRLILPLIFLVWANLHGGFVIALLVFLGWIFYCIFQDKKVNFLNILILVLSIVATLINPYNFRLWKEIWITISDQSLRSTIAEWIPIILRFDITFLTLATLSSFLIIKFWKKLNFYLVILYSLLLVMTLTSQRNAPFWTILALSLTIESLNLLKLDVSKIKYGIKRLNILGKIFFIICLLIFVFQTVYFLNRAQISSEEKFYPKQAINFLKIHQVKGNLFSPYAWGGYLIWKLPETKLFIDGRMPSWKNTNSPSNEETNAYKKYREIVYDKGDFEKLAQKYQIKTVLWFKPTPKTPPTLADIYLQKLEELFNQPIDNLGDDYFIKNLLVGHWKLVYQDQIAVIYQKN